MALTVKLNNVSEVIPLDTVPVIVAEPEPVFNDRPVGKDPDCTEKDVALVAVIVIVEIVDPAANDPNDPADVCHARTEGSQCELSASQQNGAQSALPPLRKRSFLKCKRS